MALIHIKSSFLKVPRSSNLFPMLYLSLRYFRSFNKNMFTFTINVQKKRVKYINIKKE